MVIKKAMLKYKTPQGYTYRNNRGLGGQDYEGKKGYENNQIVINPSTVGIKGPLNSIVKPSKYVAKELGRLEPFIGFSNEVAEPGLLDKLQNPDTIGKIQNVLNQFKIPSVTPSIGATPMDIDQPPPTQPIQPTQPAQPPALLRDTTSESSVDVEMQDVMQTPATMADIQQALLGVPSVSNITTNVTNVTNTANVQLNTALVQINNSYMTDSVVTEPIINDVDVNGPVIDEIEAETENALAIVNRAAETQVGARVAERSESSLVRARSYLAGLANNALGFTRWAAQPPDWSSIPPDEDMPKRKEISNEPWQEEYEGVASMFNESENAVTDQLKLLKSSGASNVDLVATTENVRPNTLEPESSLTSMNTIKPVFQFKLPEPSPRSRQFFSSYNTDFIEKAPPNFTRSFAQPVKLITKPAKSVPETGAGVVTPLMITSEAHPAEVVTPVPKSRSESSLSSGSTTPTEQPSRPSDVEGFSVADIGLQSVPLVPIRKRPSSRQLERVADKRERRSKSLTNVEIEKTMQVPQRSKSLNLEKPIQPTTPFKMPSVKSVPIIGETATESPAPTSSTPRRNPPRAAKKSINTSQQDQPVNKGRKKRGSKKETSPITSPTTSPTTSPSASTYNLRQTSARKNRKK